MSMIICSRCGKRVDTDLIECVPDPKTSFDLMCMDHEEDDEAADD